MARFLTQLGAGPDGEDGLPFALTSWLETAVLLEDRRAAALLSQRLAPMAALPTCIARHLGAASILLGDPVAARRYYELGLELAGRMRHRPEAAVTRLQLAELGLGAVGGRQSAVDLATPGPHPSMPRAAPRMEENDPFSKHPDPLPILGEGTSGRWGAGGGSVGARHAVPVPSDAQRSEALQHLDFAIAELEEMKMQPALSRARTLENSIRGPRPSSPAAAYPDGLSMRQVEVLRLLADGQSNREIADLLVLSERTVERHIADIYQKIGAGGRSARSAAISYALSHNLRPDSSVDTP